MTGAIAAHTLQTDQAFTDWKSHLKAYMSLAALSLSRYPALVSLPVLFDVLVSLVLACLLFSCCPFAPARLWLPVCTAPFTILGEQSKVKILVWLNPVATQGCNGTN